MSQEKKKHHKLNWDQKTTDQKLESFTGMLDKSFLSYPHLMRRSFVSGIFTGLGATVGVTLLFVILSLLFKVLDIVPVIRDVQAVKDTNQFINQLNPRNR
jgi:hypothetical protein